MKDSVILGTGNSRYLKSVSDFKSLYPTYDDFAAALVAGTLPVDFNGINTAGFQQVGDALGKETLLKDATAALLGGDESMLPDEALSALIQVVKSNYSELSSALNGKAKIAVGSYVGTGVSGVGHDNRLTFPFVPKIVIIRAETSSRFKFPAIFVYGTDSNFVFETQSNYIGGANFEGWRVLVLTWNGTTLYWRCGTSDENSHPDYQLNENGKKYIYIAIG